MNNELTIDGVLYRRVEEKKEVIPVGIKSFKTPSCEIRETWISPNWLSKDREYYYKEWVNALTKGGCTIHSIEDSNGTIWRVGETVKMRYDNLFRIDKFKWSEECCAWTAYITDLDNNNPISPSDVWVSGLQKLPSNQPICELPDENGVMVKLGGQEDIYWYIDHNRRDGVALSNSIVRYQFFKDDHPYYVYYATKLAAEQAHKKIWERKKYVWVVKQDWSIKKEDNMAHWNQVQGWIEFETEAEALQYILEHKPVYPEKLRGLADKVISDYHDRMIASSTFRISLLELSDYLKTLPPSEKTNI